MNGILLQLKIPFINVAMFNKLFPQNVILNIIYRNDDPNHNEMYEKKNHKKTNITSDETLALLYFLDISLKNEGSEY